MAGPNEERDPMRRSRADELRDAQARPAGDPRLTGARGTPGRPYHVVIDDASDKFFDSFRAPSAAEGPQRPGGAGDRDRTGEGMFRAAIEGADALAEATRQAASQMRAQVDMVGRWTADMGRWTALYREEQAAERIRVDDVLTRIEQHYARLASTTGGGRAGRRPGGQRPAGPSTGPVPDLDNPLPDGTFPASDAPDGDADPAPGSTGRQRPAGPQGRPQARGDGWSKLAHHNAAYLRATHGGLRRFLNTKAAEDLHQRYGMGTERNPTVVPVRNQAGEVTHFEERDAAGNVLRSVVADTEEGRSLARTALRMASISRAAGAIAAGRGLGGALSGAVSGAATAGAGGVAGAAGGAAGTLARVGAKAIPVVGWALAALDVVGAGLRFAQEQRAKNVQYQSIYGGANTEGFGQRLQEEGFAWGQFFTTGLQDEDARKLFKGVSSLGFRDSQRGELLDFAQKQYKNLGMSVDQSLQAIEIAARGSNTQLVGLEKALTRVSQAARVSGQSADQLRQKFLGTFQATTQAGFGISAAQVAGIVTAEGPGGSRGLQGVDYTGAFTEGQQRFTAAQLGVSYGELVYQNSIGNTVPGLEALDKRIQTAVNTVLSGGAKRWLDSKIQEVGGRDKVKGDTGLQASIGQELTRYIDPGAVKAVAEGLVGPGTLANVPEDKVGEWVVRNYVGAGDLSEAAEAEQAGENQRPLAEGERHGVEAEWGVLGAPAGTDFIQDNYGMNPFSGEVRSKNSALDAYSERQGQTGMADPAIEAFIQTTGKYSEIGVEVQTKDGKKVVSKDEAIRYYGDQIAKGTARIVGGPPDMDGMTIGQLTGVTQQDYTASHGRDTDTTNDTAAEGAPGVSAEEWKEGHPSSYEEEGGGSGTYKIELSDETKRFFRLVGPQNPQVESGAAAGVPPAVGGGG